MQPAIRTGALLDRVRADLGRPDASPQQLRTALAEVVPAAEELLAQVADLQGQLAQARTCPVTGLPTRSAWTTQAQEVLAAGPAAVLLADLDAFKPVNDRFGHAAGDAVLAAVGARLAQWAAAEGAVAGRLGGDEFAVALPDGPGLSARITRLHTLLTAPIAYRDLTLTVGASIGTARTARPHRRHRVRRAQAGRHRDVPGQGPGPPRPPSRGDRAAAHPCSSRPCPSLPKGSLMTQSPLLPEEALNLPNALILLLGASGSGKTRTSKMFEPHMVLRADDLRAMCADDPGSQQVNGPVWQALHTMLDARLGLGLRTAVDATNANAGDRQELIRAGRSHGAPVVALLMGTAPSVAQARNAVRAANRCVPADIVATQHAQIVAAHPRLAKEGFDHIVFAEELPVLGTALERLAREERAAEPIADVRRAFGDAAADLFDWDTPSRDMQYRTGTFGAGGESLRVRWMDDGDPYDLRFEALVSCPTDWCAGPAWTPVRSVAELAAAHRNNPLDDTQCVRCDS